MDWYNGGMEHTTLHLLYSRFWHKFLYDIGVVPTSEPYKRRTSHGLVLGENGQKMSKSRGNVVNPDEMVERYGADAFRLYEMFMGAFDQPTPWSTNGLVGMYRFLERVWRLKDKVRQDEPESDETAHVAHRTTKEVGERIEAMKFNTAAAALMEMTNYMSDLAAVPQASWERFIKLLSPFAPHIAEELWELLGNTSSVLTCPWPPYDENKATADMIAMPVQVNGKLRARVELPADADEDTVREAALADEKVKAFTDGKEIRKVIVVPGRLINIVVG